jgi:hypothetical protein
MEEIKSITIVYCDAKDNQLYTVGHNGVKEIRDLSQEWKNSFSRRYDVVMDITTLHIEECSVIVEY